MLYYFIAELIQYHIQAEIRSLQESIVRNKCEIELLLLRSGSVPDSLKQRMLEATTKLNHLIALQKEKAAVLASINVPECLSSLPPEIVASGFACYTSLSEYELESATFTYERGPCTHTIW